MLGARLQHRENKAFRPGRCTIIGLTQSGRSRLRGGADKRRRGSDAGQPLSRIRRQTLVAVAAAAAVRFSAKAAPPRMSMSSTQISRPLTMKGPFAGPEADVVASGRIF